MQILILGGSNSVLRGGYITRAIEILSRNTCQDVHVSNLSVGGTSTITAISRVFDLPDDYIPDLIVYEYALNDAGHFSPRRNGAEIQKFVIMLLIDLLAARFPEARFVPLMFGMKPFFAPASAIPFYAVQTGLWTAADIPHLDVRRRLAFLFANSAPEWLYSDIAHYSVPHGMDIVGPMVGRFLVELLKAPRLPMHGIARQMRAAHGAPPFAATARKAADLADSATGDWEVVTRTNRLMSVPALRLRAGAGLALPVRPLNLALLSDRRHDLVHATRATRDGARHWNLATRFLDVDNPIANPPGMDRFFYSGIALPLLSVKAGLVLDESRFALEVPECPDPSLPIIAFDTFAGRPPPVEERYVDVVSCLSLVV